MPGACPALKRGVAVPSFLPVPVDGRVAKGHGETVKRYHVQIDSSEVSGHDEIVSVRAKNTAPERHLIKPSEL